MDLKKVLVAALRNWKTTSVALGMIAVALGQAVPLLFDGDANTQPNWNVLIPEIMAALALLFARDADVSSQDSGVR